VSDLNQQERVKAAKQAVEDIGTARQKKMEVVATLLAARDARRDVEARLAALDATEAQAMSAWAAGGAKGPAPTLDHAKRDDLKRELEDSKAQAQAAQAAAQAVQAEVDQLHRDADAAAATHKVESLAYLASFADDIGADYRQALMQAERCKSLLFSLNRFLAANQNANDPRTTAFLPNVNRQYELRD
jgi:hypothetical protein